MVMLTGAAVAATAAEFPECEEFCLLVMQKFSRFSHL